MTWSLTLDTVGAPEIFPKSSGIVNTKGLQIKALFDSGSTESFIHPRLAEKVSLTVHPPSVTVSMAMSTSVTVSITGTGVHNLSYQEHTCAGFKPSVWPGRCADNTIFPLKEQNV